MSKKRVLLLLGILFDLIGMLSYVFPGVGELIDFVWAPISAVLMFVMYKGVKGAVGGILSGIEELSPGFDVIPSFTIMWVYTYYIQQKEVKKELKK